MDLQRQCNKHKLIILIVVSLSLFSPTVSAETKCKKIDSCKCSYDDSNRIVDLSPLIGKPRWLDQYDTQAVNMYSYNPCKPFDEGTCKNVAVCQNTGLSYYDMGTQESVEFSINPQTGALSLVYSSTDSIGVKRTSQILTQCAPDGPDAFSALGETAPGSGYYLFTLSSKHCCPVFVPSDSGTFSIGTMVALGLIAIVVLYVGLGTFIQGCVRRKTGRDAFPHYAFWSGLPSLVRDGCIIFFTCGRHSTYESL